MNETPEGSAGAFQYVRVGGVKLRIYTRGLDSPGVPLLVCNGLGQSIEILLPLLAEILDRPIIAFDAVGAGLSELPAQDFSIQQHAELVCGLLDHLSIPQVDVLGISWGGALAQQLARMAPERCRKLVLVITSTGGMATWWGSPVALFEIQFPFRYTNRAYGNFIGPWMYGGEALIQPHLFRDYAKHAIRPSYKGYAAQVRAMCSWSSLGWVHRLPQPKLVIAGLFDTLIPVANQLALATLIPNARLSTYPAGHLLMYSSRAAVGRELSDFLGWNQSHMG